MKPTCLILSVLVSIGLTSMATTRPRAAAPGEPQYEILYSSRHYVQRGRSYYQIRRVSPTGGNSVQLTHAKADCEHPVASPDGKWILYQRGYDIWMMTADGRKNRRVLSAKPQWSLVRLRAWSPNHGALLLDVEAEKHHAEATYLFDPLTKRLSKLASVAGATPAPRGSLLLMPTPSREAIQGGSIIDGTGEELWTLGESVAAWCPDGQRLAVLAPAGCYESHTVFLFCARDGKEEHSQTVDHELALVWYSLRCSPRSDSVLVAEYGGNSTSRFDYYHLLHLDSGNLRQLGQGMGACWSPDGRYVAWRTGRKLMPLDPPREVWTTQIVVYDEAAGSRLPLTYGLKSNQHLSWIQVN